MLSAEVNSDTLRIWHNRLGHVAESTLSKLAEMSDEVNLTEAIPELTPCETCAMSTLQSNPHNSHTQPGEAPLDLIYSDVLGPFQPGLDGSRFIVTFLCDATQLSEVYCIKAKGDVLDCFKHFKLHYERLDRRIHRLRADNGGEYTSLEMLRYLFRNGIAPEFTVPGNPQQNGAAEKFGHVLWTRAKTFSSTPAYNGTTGPKWFVQLTTCVYGYPIPG